MDGKKGATNHLKASNQNIYGSRKTDKDNAE
jgi:hypothetical protein